MKIYAAVRVVQSSDFRIVLVNLYRPCSPNLEALIEVYFLQLFDLKLYNTLK